MDWPTHGIFCAKNRSVKYNLRIAPTPQYKNPHHTGLVVKHAVPANAILYDKPPQIFLFSGWKKKGVEATRVWPEDNAFRAPQGTLVSKVFQVERLVEKGQTVKDVYIPELAVLLLLQEDGPDKVEWAIQRVNLCYPQMLLQGMESAMEIFNRYWNVYTNSPNTHGLTPEKLKALLFHTDNYAFFKGKLGFFYDDFVGRLNHSCNPNSMLLKLPNRLVLVSLRPISEREEVTIGYFPSKYGVASNADLENFTVNYFQGPCSELLHRKPLDYEPVPRITPSVEVLQTLQNFRDNRKDFNIVRTTFETLRKFGDEPEDIQTRLTYVSELFGSTEFLFSTVSKNEYQALKDMFMWSALELDRLVNRFPKLPFDFHAIAKMARFKSNVMYALDSGDKKKIEMLGPKFFVPLMDWMKAHFGSLEIAYQVLRLEFMHTTLPLEVEKKLRSFLVLPKDFEFK